MAEVPSSETVLVTGASSGIGAELARAFAAGGSSRKRRRKRGPRS